MRAHGRARCALPRRCNRADVPRRFDENGEAFSPRLALGGQADMTVFPVGGEPVTVAGPRVDGFFGIATDTPGQLFNAWNFTLAPTAQGSDSFVLAFDNVSGIAFPIPEPSTLALLVIG